MHLLKMEAIKITEDFFKRNLLKKGNGQVPVKQNSALSDIEKYGGYNKAYASYFFVYKI